MALNPVANPSDYDFITIGGVHSLPCLVPEAKREFKWDVKSGKGAQGATVTYVGVEPMKFAVTFYLWDEGITGGTGTADNPFEVGGRDHFAEWKAFVQILGYDPTKQAIKAVDFYHPSFDDMIPPLRSVVVEGISTLKHEGKGLYSRTVDFLEYFPPPPKSAVSTPTASDSTNTRGPKKPPGTPPDPTVAALDKELGDEIKKAKALGPI